jgi:hypothetical protein
MTQRAEVWLHLLLALSVGTIVYVTVFAGSHGFIGALAAVLPTPWSGPRRGLTKAGTGGSLPPSSVSPKITRFFVHQDLRLPRRDHMCPEMQPLSLGFNIGDRTPCLGCAQS